MMSRLVALLFFILIHAILTYFHPYPIKRILCLVLLPSYWYTKYATNFGKFHTIPEIDSYKVLKLFSHAKFWLLQTYKVLKLFPFSTLILHCLRASNLHGSQTSNHKEMFSPSLTYVAHMLSLQTHFRNVKSYKDPNSMIHVFCISFYHGNSF